MSKKNRVFFIISILLFCLITVFMILAGTATSPPSVGQRIVLRNIRDCIWYGFEAYHVFDESNGEKQKIILPESLIDFPPLVYRFRIEEVGDFSESCDLVYNPKGYEDNTWIVIYNGNDLQSMLKGDYVLWSNKDISRKRGVLKEVKNKKGLKYYFVPD